MKKNLKWIFIFGGVIAACVFVIIFGQLKTEKKGAEIYVDQKLYKVIESIEDPQVQSITVKTEKGWNKICYAGGEIWVEEADCKNQVCVKHGSISHTGETIVCLPNRLVVRIVDPEGGGYDAVTS